MKMEKQIKQVNHKEFYKVFREIQGKVNDASNKLNAGRVTVYDETCVLTGNIVKLGVHWNACGTQSAENAMEFAKVLMMASELVSNFKYNGYEVN